MLKGIETSLKKLEKLLGVLRLLANDEELPAELKAHKLIGEYNDCMECHIEGDFLLIWYDEEEDIITLLRIGSHSELFK
ncbi:MAG: type II toxin-antitoxin system YafQ family toxin [Alistipes shahii]